eukprot:6962056-Prorocentrum_lima.AAC.1
MCIRDSEVADPVFGRNVSSSSSSGLTRTGRRAEEGGTEVLGADPKTALSACIGVAEDLSPPSQ